MIEEYSEALLADGFTAALIGFGHQFNHEVAIYDYEKCIGLLMDRGMDEEEAIEFMDYNVVGSWVGHNTPVFLKARYI